MIVNLISSEDKPEENVLVVGITVEDLESAVGALFNGTDVVELPNLNLDALLRGTDTPGRIVEIRMVIVRDDAAVDAVIMEDLAKDGYEGVHIEAHGGSVAGIDKDWVSPLTQDIQGELNQLDYFSIEDILKNGE